MYFFLPKKIFDSDAATLKNIAGNISYILSSYLHDIITVKKKQNLAYNIIITLVVRNYKKEERAIRLKGCFKNMLCPKSFMTFHN